MATTGTQERFRLLLVQDLLNQTSLEIFQRKIVGILDNANRMEEKITIEVWSSKKDQSPENQEK